MQINNIFAAILLLISTIATAEVNHGTWVEGTNWVTDYLAHGGKIEDITGLKKPIGWQDLAEWDDMSAVGIRADQLPSHFDWNDFYQLQPVRNQLSCGSCWFFSVAAVVESLVRINYPPSLQYDLSEQEGVSCSGAGSCNGGYFGAFDYVVSHGIGHESAFPYEARNMKCKEIAPIAKLKKWSYIGEKGKSPTTEQIKAALYNYGPISVELAAVTNYSSGVYTACSSNSINHMQTIEGYVDDPAYKDFGGGWFLVRNSWNSNWGENGYIRMVYNNKNGGKCNKLGNVAAYAILEKIEK